MLINQIFSTFFFQNSWGHGAKKNSINAHKNKKGAGRPKKNVLLSQELPKKCNNNSLMSTENELSVNEFRQLCSINSFTCQTYE